MSIRYVLCDLDGTLLKHNIEIRDEELKTIEKVRNKGIRFVVCTGRAAPFCMDHLKALKVIGNRDEYVICSSGSAILNGLLEEIDVKAIEYEDLLKIIDYTDEHGIFTSFSGAKENFILEKFRDREEELAFYDEPLFLPKAELKERLKDRHIVKTMSHIFTREPQDLMKKELLPVLHNCEASSSYMHFMDINHTLAHKDKGLTYFCQAVSCKKEEVLAIGDNRIDEELLRNCGISACPANAEDDIKKAVDYISPYDCNHGAVTDVLNRFILKEED